MELRKVAQPLDHLMQVTLLIISFTIFVRSCSFGFVGGTKSQMSMLQFSLFDSSFDRLFPAALSLDDLGRLVQVALKHPPRPIHPHLSFHFATIVCLIP